MAWTLRCAQGHCWEQSGDAATGDSEPPPCPVCGAACVQREPLTETQAPVDQTVVFSQAAALAARAAANRFPKIDGYEVRELLGRGGMGAVYRAHHIALHRDVALKIILSGAHAAPEQVLRFRIEAESLASLQHPHIVQVFDVGQCDGQPYLVMEYIRGGALDVRLRETRFAPRAAAELVQHLARGMHAAHVRGIVHRDLKPANVLLDEHDQPKITDFGLAKRLSEDVNCTQPGVFVGTPRYMAPEQTLEDHRHIGPATDIYALGVILFELLVGQPPFVSESVLVTIEQIRTRPAPRVRQHAPHVALDLETICDKCLAKEPGQRYATAGDLADDLQRYLAGEPIHARPVGRGERLLMWARRRPGIAALLTLVAALCLVLSVGGVSYHLQLRAARDAAERRFALASRVVDQMLGEVGEERLVFEPHREQQRRALLEAALAFSQTLASEKPTDFLARRQLGFSYRRLGDVHRMLGQYAESAAAYEASIQQLQVLRRIAPRDPDVLRQLAAAHNFQGELLRITGHPQQARAAYQRALPLQRRLLEISALAVHRSELARTHYNLGILAKNTGDLVEAQDQLLAAIALVDTSADVNTSPQIQQHLARAQLNLGSVLRLQQRLPESLAAYRVGIDRLHRLTAAYPHYSDYKFELAQGHNGLGNALAETEAAVEAIGHYRASRQLLERLARDYPSIPTYQQELALVCNGLGAAEARRREFDAAIDAWQASAAALVQLNEGPSASHSTHGDLGICYGNMGRVYMRRGDHARAAEYFAKGLDELLPALEAQRQHPAYRDSALRQARDWASALAQLNRWELISQVAGELRSKYPSDVGPLVQAALLDRALVRLGESTSLPDLDRERWRASYEEEAVRCAEQICELEDTRQLFTTTNFFAFLRSLEDVQARLVPAGKPRP